MSWSLSVLYSARHGNTDQRVYHHQQTISGITAAAAHVAGLGAYIAGLEGITGGQEICDRIKELATKDALQKVPEDTANLLAFNGNKSG